MYSGTTFRIKSGRIIGVHQRIDRIARRQLSRVLPKHTYFPSSHDILHFEGKHGPDGLKRKSPGKDEPFHFIDPYHDGDHHLFDSIDDHIYNLAAALKADSYERAAFEASWLAHAVVDGLTPAHHYPFEEKLESLRGEGRETRVSARQKMLMPGRTRRHAIRNNWEFWGTKGVMTTHLAFEFGVASTMASHRFEQYEIDSQHIDEVIRNGYTWYYQRSLKQIADLRMYDEFIGHGWTSRLARQTRDELLPIIIEAVTIAWYVAVWKSERDTA